MGNKQKSRAKLAAQAKRNERDRLYWYHGFYAGQIDQINGKGDQRLRARDAAEHAAARKPGSK
jgi:hypothetical protein